MFHGLAKINNLVEFRLSHSCCDVSHTQYFVECEKPIQPTNDTYLCEDTLISHNNYQQ